MVKNKAIFLDRDGTINELVDGRPPRNMSEFKYIKGTKEAVDLVKNLGYLVFIVTNQPDVKDNIMTMDALNEMSKDIEMYLNIDDIMIAYDRDSIYYKPRTGMIDSLVDKYDIDCLQSYMIGDTWKDILAGQRAGLKTVLIGKNYYKCIYAKPKYVFENVLDACRFIGEKND